MATKKSGGSSRNGRDSSGKRLGLKKNQRQAVYPGNILIRQKGSTFIPGKGTLISKDHTIYSNSIGYVLFKTVVRNQKEKKMVEVIASR